MDRVSICHSQYGYSHRTTPFLPCRDSFSNNLAKDKDVPFYGMAYFLFLQSKRKATSWPYRTLIQKAKALRRLTSSVLYPVDLLCEMVIAWGNVFSTSKLLISVFNCLPFVPLSMVIKNSNTSLAKAMIIKIKSVGFDFKILSQQKDGKLKFREFHFHLVPSKSCRNNLEILDSI